MSDNADIFSVNRDEPSSGTLVNTLLSRIVYFLSLLAIAIALIIGLIYYFIIFNETLGTMRQMAPVIDPSLSYALWRFSEAEEKLVMRGALAIPVVQELYLIDESGKNPRVRHYFRLKDGSPGMDESGMFPESLISHLDAENWYYVISDLSYVNEGREYHLGRLILVMNRDYLLNRTGTAVIMAFALAVITVALFGIINGSILNRMVARPMSLLYSQLNSLDVQNLKGYRIHLEENDNEFALIEDSFNILVGRIQGQIERLEETQNYISRIIDNASVIIIGVDTNHRIRLFNRAAERLTRVLASDAYYRPWINWFFSVAERASVRDQLNSLFNGERRYFNIEGSFIGQEDQTRIISWRGVRVMDPEGFFQTIVFGIDVTEQREAQEEIINLNENLEQRVSERTRELREAFKALEEAKIKADQANRSKAAFLSAMSHEIRTPLNAILGMAEMLSKTSLDEDQKRFVNLFQLAGGELMEIINDILDYSRMDEGQLVLDRRFFRIRQLIANNCSLQAYRAHEKLIQLNFRISADLPEEIYADELRISQILNNLLSNAVKFTEEGSVFLEVGFETDAADAANSAGSLNEEGEVSGNLLISVSDTGIGIPLDKQTSVFEHFTQVDASTSRKYGGSGLGLGITRGLVELMDGDIRLASAPGEGSRFSISLPMEARGGYVNPVKASSELGALENLSLGLLERDPQVLQTYRELFSEHCRVLWMTDDQGEFLDRLSGPQSGPLLLFIEDHFLREQEPGGFNEKLSAILPTDVECRLFAVRNYGYVDRQGLPSKLSLAGEISKPFAAEDINALLRGEYQPGIYAGPGRRSRSPDFRGKRLLLVEDSRNNQIVVESFLKESGITLEMASSGKECLNLFESGRYDLILMDINMPEMDGHETTRRIRALEEKEERIPTPVYALTADALDSSVQASLESGCDGHFTKPITRVRLLEMIEGVFSDRPSRPGSRATADNKPKAGKTGKSRKTAKSRRTDSFDLSQTGESQSFGRDYNKRETIRIEADPLIRDLALKYIGDVLQHIETLREMHQSSDFAAIRDVAHRLKGEGGTYGFDEISILGRRLQACCDKAAFEDIPGIIDNLENYCRSVEVI